ncbi:hypothetical protein GUJ93_ZPchr0009g1963 [Zizania palustris]|uniref:Uncharacterized protein n=1 Tax=Zizania palustris TaxID=103762 RepID=A0A8J5RG66_ZIZPA|nr:hypothetical protein GUJ93_ZPchr0009g1963 [Zizania palustris]
MSMPDYPLDVIYPVMGLTHDSLVSEQSLAPVDMSTNSNLDWIVSQLTLMLQTLEKIILRQDACNNALNGLAHGLGEIVAFDNTEAQPPLLPTHLPTSDIHNTTWEDYKEEHAVKEAERHTKQEVEDRHSKHTMMDMVTTTMATIASRDVKGLSLICFKHRVRFEVVLQLEDELLKRRDVVSWAIGQGCQA